MTRPSRPCSELSCSSRSPVRPFAGDDDLQSLVQCGRLEQQVDPLRAVEPADGEDERAGAVRRAVGELLRRRDEHLGLEPRRTVEPIGDVLRDREQAPGLAERRAIEPLDRPHGRAAERVLAELPELGPVELVGLAELVDEPDDLVRVADRVRRELRRDDDVDGPSLRLLEVEQPPDERLAERSRPRVPLERDPDQLDLVIAVAKLLA